MPEVRLHRIFLNLKDFDLPAETKNALSQRVFAALQTKAFETFNNGDIAVPQSNGDKTHFKIGNQKIIADSVYRQLGNNGLLDGTQFMNEAEVQAYHIMKPFLRV